MRVFFQNRRYRTGINIFIRFDVTFHLPNRLCLYKRYWQKPGHTPFSLIFFFPCPIFLAGFLRCFCPETNRAVYMRYGSRMTNWHRKRMGIHQRLKDIIPRNIYAWLRSWELRGIPLHEYYYPACFQMWLTTVNKYQKRIENIQQRTYEKRCCLCKAFYLFYRFLLRGD